MKDSSGQRRGDGRSKRKSKTSGDAFQAGQESSGNREQSSASLDVEGKLRVQVEKWREKLLDLGNRNPLINCSFNPSRGVIEIVRPNCEEVWRLLAAESEAGAASMRFPWRRDLVPPPVVTEQYDSVEREKNDSGPSLPYATANEVAAVGNEPETSDNEDQYKQEKKPKEWNPPLEECLASSKLRETDFLTNFGDKAIDRRLRTLDSYSKLSLSEQGVHCLYVAFGFLKWYESGESDKELYSPLMLVPVTLSRASTDAPWELTEAEDDVIDNLCLRQRLKQDFGLELPPHPDIDELEPPGTRRAFLAAVGDAIRESERWEVADRCALGRFACPKVAMWKDL